MPNIRETQINAHPDNQLPASRMPRRAFWAILTGFLIVSSGAMLLGPSASDVAAQEDDSAAAYWARDRGAAAARARQAAGGAPLAYGVQSRVTTIFGDFFDSGARLQRQFRQAVDRPRERALARAKEQQAARLARARDLARERAHRLAAARTEQAMDAKLVSLPGPVKPRQPAPKPREARAPVVQPQRGVCVRLCDGSHFPAPVGELTDASCASVCPGAPTRAYLLRSDSVEGAVAVRDGASYDSLPVALRFTTKADRTCSCGRGDLQTRILRDATLRQGDKVMTDEGFRLFRGGASPPFSPRDFNSIADAKGLSGRERSLLVAMERAAGVSPPPRRTGARLALKTPDIARQRSEPAAANTRPRVIPGPLPVILTQATAHQEPPKQASAPN